ncbi:MAG: recombinase family protein [Pirellulaceae bacterium]|nr:recombinase family protein [Pirellulaceae bacterium]
MTPANNDKIVSYLRVSTKRQGRSGLGLEGQRAAVAEFASRNAGAVVCEYVEVETGKNNHRPELARAQPDRRLASDISFRASMSFPFLTARTSERAINASTSPARRHHFRAR